MLLPVTGLRTSFAARFHKYEFGCNMHQLVDDGFKGTLLKRKQGSRRRECCIKRDSRLINVEASNYKLGHKLQLVNSPLQPLTESRPVGGWEIETHH